MAKRRFGRLFRPSEADELIPRLEILMREIQTRARELHRRLNECARFDETLGGLEPLDLIERYPELAPLLTRMAALVGEIESMGCLLKDIDQGLVDFPFRVEDEGEEDDMAFLCWQFGEPHVMAWHPIERGFAGRRPLPGVPKMLLN